MELNTFQIVGAVAQPPRVATTQNGTQILEILVENQSSDGFNGGPGKTEILAVNLAGDFRAYQNLKQGQVILVAGRLDGKMASSQSGTPFCKIRLRPQSVTVLPYERPIATPMQQGMDGGGYGYGQPQNPPPRQQSPYGQFGV